MVTSAHHSHPTLNTLTPGVMFRQYKLLEQIGVGGQGVVWSALHPEQRRIYAIKFNEIPVSAETEADDVRDEHQLRKLATLHHPHILPITEYGFEESIRFTISPYLPGGVLTEMARTTLPLDKILRYGTEIASALDYLHRQGIIHRDLKSTNILLDVSRNSYLADFGLARIVSTSTLAFHTGHGTPPYAPPEQIQMKAITPKSDIFSFGILFYEMFTGQLPWNGKRQLGMEQSHSKQEIPDPGEFRKELPSQVWELLKRVTSAIPEERPNSAGDIVKILHSIFNIAMELRPNIETPNAEEIREKDIEQLLENGLLHWEETNGTYNLGLTKFALADLHRETIDMDKFGKFMLSQALTYGYNDEQWWANTTSLKERLLVSSLLLGKNRDAITARVIGHLANDNNIRTHSKGLPKSMTTTLLVVGAKTDNALLRQQIFEGLRTLTRPEKAWGNHALPEDQIERLGDLALEDSDAGDKTAELIGHLRSASAVKAILDHGDDERKFTVLLLIQKVAGNLPPGIKANVRFRLTIDWVIYQVLQRPVSLVSAYVLAFLGASMGVGLQVYFTINVPNFLDVARITASIEQGLIVGAIFGLGVFTTRLSVERFQSANTFLRTTVGIIVGALLMNMGLFVFHTLFVNTPPRGFLITTACVLIAMAFALGGLIHRRWAGMILSSASILMTIIGTWWIHTTFAASPLDLTPVFRYDYAWSLGQVAFVAFCVSLPIGIFGNLVDLSIVED
jgi:serine/threonine protein kinase